MICSPLLSCPGPLRCLPHILRAYLFLPSWGLSSDVTLSLRLTGSASLGPHLALVLFLSSEVFPEQLLSLCPAVCLVPSAQSCASLAWPLQRGHVARWAVLAGQMDPRRPGLLASSFLG